MATLAHDLLAFALMLLLSLFQSAVGAPRESLADGWHRWDAPAGDSGRRACCYHFRNDRAGTEGCRLDGGSDGVTIDSDCDPTSDRIRIYVRVDGGEVREIRALSAGCPVRTSTPVVAQADKDAAASIAWLDRYARGDSNLAEEAVLAIAMHEDGSAVDALTSLVESPERGMEVRERALFWLAHSGNEQAFRYLDRLLSAR